MDLSEEKILNLIHPIGSIYISVNSENPKNIFGGEWEQIKDRFLLARGDTYKNLNDVGGSATHILTKEQLPSYTLYNSSHGHTASVNTAGGSGDFPSYNNTTRVSKGVSFGQNSNANTGTNTVSVGNATITVNSGGSGKAHNNMPPYLVVNVWKRVS